MPTTVALPTEQERERREARYEARRFLWDHSTNARVRACGRNRADGSRPIDVVVQDHRAHLTNLQTCASVHACPVCMVKIRQQRGIEIAAILAAHKAAGGGAYFVTLTLPHDQGDDLAALLKAVADSWTYCHQGNGWAGCKASCTAKHRGRPKGWHALGVKARLGVVGYIRSLDLTHGRNGWHPHLHCIILTKGRLSKRHQLELLSYYRERWSARVQHHGFRAPHDFIGVTLEAVRTNRDAAAYVAKVTAYGESINRASKVALELTRPDLKRGRYSGLNPFQILDAAIHHETADADGIPYFRTLWHTYEQATKGHRAITFSGGLKARYAVEEVTDEDAANPTVGGEVVYTFETHRDYLAVARAPYGIGGLLVVAETDPSAIPIYVASCRRTNRL